MLGKLQDRRSVESINVGRGGWTRRGVSKSETLGLTKAKCCGLYSVDTGFSITSATSLLGLRMEFTPAGLDFD